MVLSLTTGSLRKILLNYSNVPGKATILNFIIKMISYNRSTHKLRDNNSRVIWYFDQLLVNAFWGASFLLKFNFIFVASAILNLQIWICCNIFNLPNYFNFKSVFAIFQRLTVWPAVAQSQSLKLPLF